MFDGFYTLLKETPNITLGAIEAVAFTVGSVKKVVGLFIYAPRGEKFPLEKWGTGAKKAAHQFWDKTV